MTCGPKYGYYHNAAKTCLIVKPDQLDSAQTLFKGTNIQISCEGQHHLGATIGTRAFTEEYVTKKVQVWSEEIRTLSDITPIVLTVHLPTVLNINGIM